MRFPFYRPISPWYVSQYWGVFNEAYKKFGFSRHNGIDVGIPLMMSDRLIRSPFHGYVSWVATKENGLWQPQGGGNFITIVSKDLYEFDDGVTAHVQADFLHCDKIIQSVGDEVLIGTVLAVAGNTGFSTGPHTHIQLRRGLWGTDNFFHHIDQNDANNSFDPLPYDTGEYAGMNAVKKTPVGWTRYWNFLTRLLKGR